jgi:glycosyltransferase involved in cell wall biosynthesis
VKVLIAHNRYRSQEPSGEDRVVDQESAALEAAGFEVYRHQTHSDDISDFSALKKAVVPASVVWNPFAARTFTRVLDEVRPDVVHVHNLFPLLSPSILVASQKRRVPVVATFHNFRQMCANGTFFRSGTTCYDCAGKYGLPAVRHGCYRGSALTTAPMVIANVAQRRCWKTVPSAYIFISESERRNFSSMEFPTFRSFVKWNFVTIGPPRTAPEDLVVFTGRLSEAKGVRLLMRAWELFEQADHPPLRLAIAGAGELQSEIQAWAATRSSVDFLGLLSREHCSQLLARARAAVVPSLWPETFGLVIAEAKAAGVAPIAPAQGSFPELIEDGVDGLLYGPNDPVALAHNLGRVAAHPHLFDLMGARARAAAQRQFTAAKTTSQLEAIYQFAINNPTD